MTADIALCAYAGKIRLKRIAIFQKSTAFVQCTNLAKEFRGI